MAKSNLLAVDRFFLQECSNKVYYDVLSIKRGYSYDENCNGKNIRIKKFLVSKLFLEKLDDKDIEIFNNNIKSIYRKECDICVIDFLDNTALVYDRENNYIPYYAYVDKSNNTYATMNKVDDIDLFLMKNYINIPQNKDLRDIDDIYIYIYLNELENTNFLIIMSVKDDSSSGVGILFDDLLHNLGIKSNLSLKSRWGFIAIINSGIVDYERHENERIEYEYNIDNTHICDITSAGFDKGDTCSIRINDIEFSECSRGLNIVVIDKKTMSLIDTVAFDTCGQLDAVRK